MKNHYEELARIKDEIAILSDEAKDLQDYVLSHDPMDKVKTAHGTLTLTTRDNFSKPDNCKFIEHFSVKDFKACASLTIASIRKVLGEAGVDKLRKHRLIKKTSTSQYYTLRG